MTCLACQEFEHDCCDNIIQPGTCPCGCALVLDPPPLRSNLVIILSREPHDPELCRRQALLARERARNRRRYRGHRRAS